jgi:2-polyprenyl-6-methoxyphenol hydroxylase-like FAD-dependent oxidoreductase
MSSKDDRIIVVGAGPVGLTAAVALGRRGIATVLLAAEPELVTELRGSTFHPPTLDLLDEFEVCADDRGRAQGSDLAVPRPRNRTGRDLRSLAAGGRHQAPVSRSMRTVEADALSGGGATQAAGRRHPTSVTR